MEKKDEVYNCTSHHSHAYTHIHTHTAIHCIGMAKYYNKAEAFILIKLYHGNVHMTLIIKMPFLWLALVVCMARSLLNNEPCNAISSDGGATSAPCHISCALQLFKSTFELTNFDWWAQHNHQHKSWHKFNFIVYKVPFNLLWSEIDSNLCGNVVGSNTNTHNCAKDVYR